MTKFPVCQFSLIFAEKDVQFFPSCDKIPFTPIRFGALSAPAPRTAFCFLRFLPPDRPFPSLCPVYLLKEVLSLSIKITADSTCDLPKELQERYSVAITPLSVILGDRALKDGVEVVPEDLYRYVDATGNLPTTSAISVGDYQDYFAAFAGNHEAVIHINISADFSSCYQNACIAAENFENVYVVDSRNLSFGHGLVVIEAALAAERGMSAPEIVDYLNDLTGRVEASFILDQLAYMVKGGRCSAVTALGANLLRLKPCIEVRDGKMSVGKKYRGNITKVLAEYVKDRLKDRDDLTYNRIFVAASSDEPEIISGLRDNVNTYASFSEILEALAGCTICSHCGPKAFGILFIRSK